MIPLPAAGLFGRARFAALTARGYSTTPNLHRSIWVDAARAGLGGCRDRPEYGFGAILF